MTHNFLTTRRRFDGSRLFENDVAPADVARRAVRHPVLETFEHVQHVRVADFTFESSLAVVLFQDGSNGAVMVDELLGHVGVRFESKTVLRAPLDVLRGRAHVFERQPLVHAVELPSVDSICLHDIGEHHQTTGFKYSRGFFHDVSTRRTRVQKRVLRNDAVVRFRLCLGVREAQILWAFHEMLQTTFHGSLTVDFVRLCTQVCAQDFGAETARDFPGAAAVTAAHVDAFGVRGGESRRRQFQEFIETRI